jgi:hypothetical protein
VPGEWGFDWPDHGQSLCPSPGQRARYELVENHHRSDSLIAQAAGCSRMTVVAVRRQLENGGVIELLEAKDRQARERHRADPPHIPALPPQPPELRLGTCVGHPRPWLWESTRTPSCREEAVAICLACPVLEPCRSWALSLSPLQDRQIGVLGGLLVADRDRIRRERRATAARERAARAATPRRRAARPQAHSRPGAAS